MRVALIFLVALVLSGCNQTEPVTSTPAAVPAERSVAADHSLIAFGGQLLGTDHGEWGGELVFADADGAQTELLKDNVLGIVSYQGRVLVFTGLNHMGLARGDLYEVTPSKGVPRLEHLGYLPGTPTSIISRADGSVTFLISGVCYELAQSGIRHSSKCDPSEPLGSNKSFKPNPLRGSA